MKYTTTDKILELSSGHPTDRGTSILILNNNCIVLKDGKKQTMLMLETPWQKEEKLLMATLKHPPSIIDPPVIIESRLASDTSTIKVLKIEYDNRGDPYRQGLLLSIDDVAVFIEDCDVRELVNKLQSKTTYYPTANL